VIPICPEAGQGRIRRSQELYRFLAGPYAGDLHARRVLSLANATIGVIKTASLAVNAIGLRGPGARRGDQASIKRFQYQPRRSSIGASNYGEEAP
jgi:hypothetical protein